MQPVLVFTYNADSGLFNTLTDMAHKVFAPESYACNLCAITYGTFGMRDEWKEYLSTLNATFVFLHRDELSSGYGITGVDLPAIFLLVGGRPHPWITAEEINACDTMADLKQLISGRLASYAAAHKDQP
jgi:hypothetical protein